MRPALASTADTNDWEAYYDYGAATVRKSTLRSEAAFYWASRLDPSRAEPLYGRWVMFWLRNFKKFGAYLEGDPRTLERSDVIYADSLRFRAYLRNPFVHEGLQIVLYDYLPGNFRNDLATQAWLAYAEPDLPKAAALWGRAIALNPDRFFYLRQHRAMAFTAMSQYDSALVEMGQLVTEMRRRDQKQLSHIYESREMLEYAIGRLQGARGEVEAARRSFGQSLVENAGFHTSHLALGALALASGDTAAAVREYEQAVEIAGSDAVALVGYGTALLRAERPTEAVVALDRAIALEAWYAEPRFLVAVALEGAGQAERALAAYGAYLERAPRSQAARIAAARRRLAALGSPSADQQTPP